MPDIPEKLQEGTVSTAYGILVNICTVFHMIPAIALSFHGMTTFEWARSDHYRGFTITHIQKHSVELLWTSDQPVAETSTWQHTTPTRDRHPCPRGDSNPQSQQASSRRPTPKSGLLTVSCYCSLSVWRSAASQHLIVTAQADQTV